MKKLSAILGFLIVAGCNTGSDNTTTGNPFVSLAMTASSKSASVAKNNSLLDFLIPSAFAYPSPQLTDSAGNVVTITSIWANFGEIEFKAEETAEHSEVDGDEIEFSNQYSVDLLSNSPSAFASGRISSTAIRRIKIKLIRTSSLPTGAPSNFLGKSVYIGGTVNGQTFSYSTEDESVIEIAGPNLVNALDSRTLLVELHIANLIKRINLSAITSTTHISDGNRVSASNPCPNIDSSSDLFNCFYKGFQKESNLGRDDDGNFQIDSDEDSVK